MTRLQALYVMIIGEAMIESRQDEVQSFANFLFVTATSHATSSSPSQRTSQVVMLYP